MAITDNFNSGDGQAGGKPQKPNPIAILANMIHAYRKQGILANQMPPDPAAAARWFMGRMEPQQQYEGMRLERTTRKVHNEDYWQFPYLDRMKYLLKKFMALSDNHQSIILGCCEEGVYWRGEDVHHFFEAEVSVYNETLRMRELGAPEYRKEALQKMKTLNFGQNGQKKSPEEDSEPCIAF